MRADAKKSTTCDKKYKESVDACRTLQDKYYDQEMPRILRESQAMEETRLERQKLVWNAYVELQRSVSPEILSSCDLMSTLIDAVDPKGDLDSFVQEKKSNESPPDRVVYEPYSPEVCVLFLTILLILIPLILYPTGWQVCQTRWRFWWQCSCSRITTRCCNH